MPNITVTQEVTEVNITVEQNGESYTLQPVLVVGGGGGGGGGVQSVTGNIVDNTDPLNPIIVNPEIVQVQGLGNALVTLGQGIDDNASAISTLEGNRLLEVQAGANVTVDNADPLRPIVNASAPSSGGGKAFIHISGNFITTTYPNWITWQATSGYYLTTWNTTVLDDGSGSPVYSVNEKGILIPKGFKVNRIVWNHLTIANGDFETLAILAKPLTADEGTYKVYANGDFEGFNNTQAPNLFEIYRELYYDAPLNPFTATNSRQYKREMICTTAGGANEATDNDCQLLLYFRRTVSDASARVNFSGFIEIEPI